MLPSTTNLLLARNFRVTKGRVPKKLQPVWDIASDGKCMLVETCRTAGDELLQSAPSRIGGMASLAVAGVWIALKGCDDAIECISRLNRESQI